VAPGKRGIAPWRSVNQFASGLAYFSIVRMGVELWGRYGFFFARAPEAVLTAVEYSLLSRSTRRLDSTRNS